MSSLTSRPTLRDFLRGSRSPLPPASPLGPLTQVGARPASPTQGEGFILLDFIPSISALGIVIRESRAAARSPSGRR